MTVSRFAAVFAMLLAVWNPASAQPDPTAALLAANRQLSLAASGNLFNYKEILPGPGDRESGWTPGFQAKAESLFNLPRLKNLYASVQFDFADGTVGYHGHVQNLRTGVIRPLATGSGLTTETVRAEFGKGLFVRPDLLITPVAQLGYRNWNRDVAPGRPYESQEDYRHFYAGLAVQTDYAPTPRLVLRGRLGWAETFGAHDDSAGVDGAFRLGSRPVWQAGIGADYRVSRRLHLNLAAAYEYFSYGRSAPRPTARGFYAYEPSSRTSGVTLAGGLGWSF